MRIVIKANIHQSGRLKDKIKRMKYNNLHLKLTNKTTAFIGFSYDSGRTLFGGGGSIKSFVKFLNIMTINYNGVPSTIRCNIKF